MSSEVEVSRVERQFGEDEFIVIASDGLWDVMTAQDGVDFVRAKKQETGSKKGIANMLVKESLERETSDNVSAIVIWL